MACLEKPGRDAILRDYIEKYPEEIQAMLDADEDKPTQAAEPGPEKPGEVTA